jgi:cell wall-associated NlpC family hydrolase
MQIRARNGVPNHAGIYLGDGLMLHHLYGRLSSRDLYGGWYLESTRAVLRYQHKT